MKYFLILFVLACMISATANAQAGCSEIVFSVDVPSSFGGTTIQAYQAVKCKEDLYESPVYFNGQGLSAATNIVSLVTDYTKPKGFYFTVDASVTVSTTYCKSATCTFTPRDIVRAECISGPGCTTDVPGSPTWNYWRYKSGSELSLPFSAVMDSLSMSSDDKFLISFDAPVSLPIGGGSYYTFQPSDIVKLVADTPSAQYQMYIEGATIGLGAGTNVCGFEVTDTDSIFMFDAPGKFGPPNGVRSGWGYRRGPEGWDEDTFFSDVSFPAGSIATDFMLPGAIGIMDTSRGDGTPNLQVTKNGSNLTFTWEGPGTSGCGFNLLYGIYEGTTLSSSEPHYDYVPAKETDGTTDACDESGTSQDVQPGVASLTYYVVVPMTAGVEGSYGADSVGTERPQSTSPCHIVKKSRTCSW